MKVAMFIRNTDMEAMRVEALNVMVFDIDNNTIKGMENDCLYNKSIDYISLWLINKKIDTIYIEESDEEITSYFNKLNISVKTHNDLEQEPLLKMFMV